MKLKRIRMIVALALCIGALASSHFVFASETSDTDPEKGVSDVESVIPDGALTPDGTGTILDAVSEEDDKQFYTITTEDGSIFYLIIDGRRTENNVYFLNTVTIEDLMALAEKSGDDLSSSIPFDDDCICTDKCEAGAINEDCEVCKKDWTVCVGKAAQPSDPKETPEKSGSHIGIIIFIVIAVLAALGVGIYVKIIRPKKNGKDKYDDEDEEYGEDAEYGESFGLTPEYRPSYDLPEDEENSENISENLSETDSEDDP